MMEATELKSDIYDIAEHTIESEAHSETEITNEMGLDSLKINSQKDTENIQTREGYSDLTIGKRRLDYNNIKLLNRAASKNIPIETKEEFTLEHSQLIEKKFAHGLTEKESRRLTYVRWQIDRIEDAELGDHLDQLSRALKEREDFAEQLNSFVRNLKR